MLLSRDELSDARLLALLRAAASEADGLVAQTRAVAVESRRLLQLIEKIERSALGSQVQREASLWLRK
jgi:hypothetical protein